MAFVSRQEAFRLLGEVFPMPNEQKQKPDKRQVTLLQNIFLRKIKVRDR
jgi:hypothetical protein